MSTQQLDVALQIEREDETLAPLHGGDDGSVASGYSLEVQDGQARGLLASIAALLAGAGTGPVYVKRIAHDTLGGHRVVTSRDDGELEYADNDNIAQVNRAMWLTTSAWLPDDLATVVAYGLVTEPSWNWTPGVALFLGDDGNITETMPDEGDAFFCLQIGSSITETEILFNPSIPVMLSFNAGYSVGYNIGYAGPLSPGYGSGYAAGYGD